MPSSMASVSTLLSTRPCRIMLRGFRCAGVAATARFRPPDRQGAQVVAVKDHLAGPQRLLAEHAIAAAWAMRIGVEHPRADHVPPGAQAARR